MAPPPLHTQPKTGRNKVFDCSWLAALGSYLFYTPPKRGAASSSCLRPLGEALETLREGGVTPPRLVGGMGDGNNGPAKCGL